MTDESLRAGFRDPPQSARPLVWWHWMNGNVTREGVRLDLEWMQRIGIGGVQNFDAVFEGWGPVFDTPQVVERPVKYLSDEWREIFRASVRHAADLGLEFGIASSPGWSESGGPWVEPRQAMKKLVWSETWIQGGATFGGKLALPPRTTGLFLNVQPLRLGGAAGQQPELPTYYEDVATVAFRAPEVEIAANRLEPVVTSSGGPLDTSLLSDGDLATAAAVPFGEEPHAWIQFAFEAPQRIQAISAVIGGPFLGVNPVMEPRARGWLEVSDDGRVFRKLVDLPHIGAPQQTVSFAPVRARLFRVVLERPEPTLIEQLGLAAPPQAHSIAELVLHTGVRVNRFEDKAGFSSRHLLDDEATVPVAEADAIRTEDIVDLTSRMRADGTLEWMPPPGRWIVLRFGCSLTGSTNLTGSAPGRGLEVDKLSREHVKTYMDAYLAHYEKVLGPNLGRSGLRHMVTDSYEAGPQNWTDDMRGQFKRRRGYELVPWLPVIAGRVVRDSQSSERFLWDFRKTLGDLMSEAHYGQISASLHERGLIRYGESHERFRAYVGDGMEAKKTADVPMGALWTAAPPGFTQQSTEADLRESASVAHIYGKSIVGAEAFTAIGNTYAFAPEDLKPFADRGLAFGVSRFVIHASVHQPDDRPGPGMTLGPTGQSFTRKETWAHQAREWVQYLARSSYLMQQGRFVADIAYLYGDDTNIAALFDTTAPDIPEGYNFDFLNVDALLNELSVKDGKLVTRAGMEYRVLTLAPSLRQATVPVLRKIRDLVRAGAVLAGERPVSSPSLVDDPGEFRALVEEVWGQGDGERARERTAGLGRVFSQIPLADVLARMQVLPDVTFKGVQDSSPRFAHRAVSGVDLYFLNNDSSQAQALEASFRTEGRRPEAWRADTGMMTPLSYRFENGRTIVPMTLGAHDALFVVFGEPTHVRTVVFSEPATAILASVTGPWNVRFPSQPGAPSQQRFEALHSWAESDDASLKYFSGSAVYEKTVEIPAAWITRHTRIMLDLGTVKNVATVVVNRRSLGVLWKPPFTIDVTDALHAGANSLEIEVSNLWPNRLIGDRQPGAERTAFATFDPFTSSSPLLPSGLLGPVSFHRVERSGRP